MRDYGLLPRIMLFYGIPLAQNVWYLHTPVAPGTYFPLVTYACLICTTLFYGTPLEQNV